MPHPCIENAAATLHHLRQASITATAEEGGHISPEVYFSWDKAQAEVAIALHSGPGQLVSAAVTLKGTPRWFALNIGLGAGAFAAGDRVGLVIDAGSTVAFACHALVRSSKQGETFDTPLAQEIRLTPPGGTQVVLHTLAASDPMVWTAGYHTLILPLPMQSCRFDLRDLRLVHLAADAGGAQHRTLTSVAC